VLRSPRQPTGRAAAEDHALDPTRGRADDLRPSLLVAPAHHPLSRAVHQYDDRDDDHYDPPRYGLSERRRLQPGRESLHSRLLRGRRVRAVLPVPPGRDLHVLTRAGRHVPVGCGLRAASPGRPVSLLHRGPLHGAPLLRVGRCRCRSASAPRSKPFTLDEMEHRITKLKLRLAAVQPLDPQRPLGVQSVLRWGHET